MVITNEELEKMIKAGNVAYLMTVPHFLRGLRKAKYICQDKRSTGQASNQGPPECDEG
jgi:hypothetical protein